MDHKRRGETLSWTQIKNIVRKNILLLILLTTTLLLLRFDFTYNLSSYKVEHGDTMWSILRENVFDTSAITGISIKHLTETNPGVDWHQIEANRNGEGGYTDSYQS